MLKNKEHQNSIDLKLNKSTINQHFNNKQGIEK
ncbi:hypothetical protein N483_26775 [Pseudoalteromonas luteoviolacea NCIMB 1944]|nr:hypothetical protein N483_26775 [Pseudoalteromonas luteoviolacea NCIMB 1944]